MLPATDLTNQLKFDPYTNTMILTTRADVIKNIMQLITILDETGFEQAVELLKLQHAQAKDVVELFKSILGPDAAKKNAPINIAAGTRTKYFSENIRVENLDPNNIRQLNTIVLIGKPEDIESVRTFIKKYIDIAQDKGNSFFHVVDVQWMQASHLANVLNNLIKGGSSSSGQSSSTPSVSELSFDPQIQIMAETVQQGPTNTESVSSSGQQNTIQRGANRLVIACTPRDWERLEPLIKQIDIPQKQVLIEARIVNMTKDCATDLGVRWGISNSTHLSGTLEGAIKQAAGMTPGNVPISERLNLDLGATPFDANPASVGIALAKLGDNVLLDLELSALESEGRAEIVASPRLMTVNQRPAVIESGEDIPYQESTLGGATAVAFKNPRRQGEMGAA